VGKAERRKGLDRERELAHLLGGRRVPLSGAAGGDYIGDVKGLGLTWEVKARGDGFRELYRWLDGVDALALRADRRPWLVVVPLTVFSDFAAMTNGGPGAGLNGLRQGSRDRHDGSGARNIGTAPCDAENGDAT